MASSMVLLLALVPFVSAAKSSFLGQASQDLRAADTELDSLLEEREAWDQDQDSQDVNPRILVGVGVAVVLILAFVVFLKIKSGSNAYSAFGNKSGLSTSSSDITSSETGSTDKELKSRMERFEKRLEEHKRMIEAKDGASSTSGSESQGSSVGGIWMK
eukprot:gnl/MRDRNA2_/MRDRNA2_30358_c0_seq1.p1 gnl/MRDRNA2_/MRDRNA2_30358_c0~~gnl/MRDRNA2_/MRDRNA2_30358_c0_seq1.p1  ORF type:complete len:187 (-),score=40.39 gnl/MRDRNA2_/MRDRNA2_30358_c0_seq1:171-647(-)